LDHRESVDFAFFSDEPLPDARKDRLKAETSVLPQAEVIQSDMDTSTILVPVDHSTVTAGGWSR
jgi:hypothetical protein